jgi:hypothetical protein
MADGQFLRDISSGIFNRLRELDRDQQVKDEKSKLQTIELLSGLAGQVEPDSLPLLMSHIGQTIGVKGKLKGFWDAFSGMPNRSQEDQLGTILNQVTSSMVGPQEAKQARQTYKGELLEPFRAQGTRPRSVEQLPYKTPPTLADRLILRDPRQEKLEELETRYGAQLENQRVMQDQRYQDALGRQQNQSRLKLEEMNAKSQIDSMKAINALSNQLLAGDKSLTPQMAVEKAGDILGSTAEARLGALRALEPLRAAQTTQAQAIASSMKTNKGLSPNQALNEKKTAEGVFKAYNLAKGDIAGAKKTMADLSASITSRMTKGMIRGRFDPNIGDIILDDPKDDLILKFDEKLPSMLAEYRKAAAIIEKAKVIGEGHRKTLGTYPQYYKVGPTIDDPVEEIQMKAAPPKAKGSTGRALRPGERVEMGTQGIRVSEAQGKAQGYFPGDTKTIGGRSYKIRELRNGFWILDPITTK